MNNFNFISRKYLLIIVFILLCFILLISNAFDSVITLTEKNYNDKYGINIENKNILKEKNNKNLSMQYSENDYPDDEIGNVNQEEKQEGLNVNLQPFIDFNLDESIDVTVNHNQVEELETITIKEDYDKNGNSNIDNVDKFDFAKRNVELKQYDKALSIYNEILKEEKDARKISMCYEESAKIYALKKHYGSALLNANKAYNIEKTSSRALLLAKLYYKTGNIKKSHEYINELLNKDF